VTLHISASKIKYLEVAEELELKKRDNLGVTREFTVSQLDDFLDDGMYVDDLLTTAEREYIVRHELENIRARNEDEQVPGYPAFRLYEGQSIGRLQLKHTPSFVKTEVKQKKHTHTRAHTHTRRCVSGQHDLEEGKSPLNS
jgi:hypothetical protein